MIGGLGARHQPLVAISEVKGMENSMGSVLVWTFDLVLLGLLIALSAFFSGSETAFLSLNRLQRTKLQEEGSSTLAALLAHPQKLLITILAGNMIVNIFASSYAAGLCYRFFGKYGVFLSTGIMTFVILIFGEITPKTFAVQYPEPFVRHAALPLHLFSKGIMPMSGARSMSNGPWKLQPPEVTTC